jgi:hypothetical protein
VGEPWREDAYAIGGLWWDHEAAARQLPYHRTQVKRSAAAAPVAAGTWCDLAQPTSASGNCSRRARGLGEKLGLLPGEWRNREI